MRETVTLNRKEQTRLMVLAQVDRCELTPPQAAEVLCLSERQVWRMLAAYRQEGVAALAHGNRGRTPSNTVEPTVRQQVVAFAQSAYAGCNHQHLSELLAEREGIRLSRSTLRRILLGAGLPSPRTRRAPQHRRRRERLPQEGMLLQLDASLHDWLEGRGPRLTLLGAIDDATSKVAAARFQQQEDAAGYFLLFQDIVTTYGIPVAIYRDRHAVFAPTKEVPWTLEDELAGRQAPTQFGRLLEELGVQSIAARSPQAKGRIERLWGTFQDRLVTELRLAGAATGDQANQVLREFLPRFNVRFPVPATQKDIAYRPLPPGVDPATLFCFKHLRTVGTDNVVQFGQVRLQLPATRERASYARVKVEVHEHLDGSLAVYYQGRTLSATAAPLEAPRLRPRGGPRPTAVRPAAPAQELPAASAPPSKPPANHPWRRYALTKSLDT